MKTWFETRWPSLWTIPVGPLDASDLRTQEFDYYLPSERIAKRPAPRGSSRLFVLDSSPLEHHQSVTNLASLLRRGDLLVLNNTRVLRARLFARRAGSGGGVQLLLAEKLGPRRWAALARPSKRLHPGDELELAGGLRARIEVGARHGLCRLCFDREIEGLLPQIGHVPLPPYLGRPEEPEDEERYQTVYASEPGAVAAPTAGLHFSHELLSTLEGAGISTTEITLHVGVGTFRPVTAENVEDHSMHAERYRLDEAACAAINRARSEGRRIVAVGTTVVRALESAALKRGEHLQPGAATTDLFIRPGFRFELVDALLTNFHLPRSTLLMLVCAFAGTARVMAAYEEAAREGYGFYSYGDAMLLERRAGRGSVACHAGS